MPQTSGTPAAPSTSSIARLREDHAQRIARSVALRRVDKAKAIEVPLDAATAKVAPVSNFVARDPVLAPDDGHHLEYEADVDPAHPHHIGGRQPLPSVGRGPWRERSAYLAQHHVELDEVCTICQTEAHEAEMMRRLISRHMFHRRCAVAAVEVGPNHLKQDLTVTCPNCKGDGHVIACWNSHGHFRHYAIRPQNRARRAKTIGDSRSAHAKDASACAGGGGAKVSTIDPHSRAQPRSALHDRNSIHTDKCITTDPVGGRMIHHHTQQIHRCARLGGWTHKI